MKKLIPFPFKASLVSILILSGCIATSSSFLLEETAQRLAAPAWMIKRDITAETYILRSYERIHKRRDFANLYIEGDNIVNLANPTPKYPLALHLASKDNAENVIYLARPCQYTGKTDYPHSCDVSDWTDNQFSEDVIKSYNAALDDIAVRYQIKGFNLIGHAGGASIASLLAAERGDVLSLRTVAGILDHDAHRALHRSTPLSGSLNPVTYASDLTNMPQYHFIGGQDQYVPTSILHRYLQALPPSNCVQTLLVQEAEYENGWADKWPELLALPVTCNQPLHGDSASIPTFDDLDNNSASTPENQIKSFEDTLSPAKP